jgi:hypothetical protein
VLRIGARTLYRRLDQYKKEEDDQAAAEQPSSAEE